MRITFLLLIGFLTANLSFSQRQEISVITGYGNADYQLLSPKHFVSPFSEKNLEKSIVIGSNYHYNIGDREILQFNTGLLYHLKIKNNFHHLFIPIGCNIDHGKKFHFFYGLGLNGKFLISSPPSTEPNSDTNPVEFKKAQIGWYYSIGFGYRINKQLDITLGYQMNMDLTRFYDDSSHSPGGSLVLDDHYESEGSIRLAISYTLKTKQ